jgi:hypothetical protein
MLRFKSGNGIWWDQSSKTIDLTLIKLTFTGGQLYRKSNMPNYDNKSISSVFEPEDDLRHLATHFPRIPHYLFRNASPRSSGITTENFISSVLVQDDRDRSNILSR